MISKSWLRLRADIDKILKIQKIRRFSVSLKIGNF